MADGKWQSPMAGLLDLKCLRPPLERASGANADKLRATAVGEATPDEWAALWMARAIMEAPNVPAQRPC